MSEKISGKRLSLLNLISNCESERGMRPKDMVKEIPLKKSTISYHLGRLEERDMVTSVVVGRSKFVDITEKAEELIENKPEEPVVASCGSCGENHSSFEDAKNCCTGENRG